MQQAIIQPQVTDGVIQGQSVRLILKKHSDQTALLNALGKPDAKLIPATPRFEDAFIDLLGGGPSHKSELAEIMPQIPQHPMKPLLKLNN